MKKRNLINHKAFTLIEVLLGLLIFSIVSLSLYNVFWLGIKIQEKADVVNKSYQELYAALEIMRNDLENAFIYDFSGSYPQKVSFKGESNEFSLLRPTDQGIKKIRYFSSIPKLGKSTQIIINQYFKSFKKKTFTSNDNLPIYLLMRQESLLIEEIATNSHSKGEEILTATIKKDSLRFQYGSIKSSSDNKNLIPKQIEWKDNWKSNTLPFAIRMELTIFGFDNAKDEVVLRKDFYLPPIEAE